MLSTRWVITYSSCVPMTEEQACTPHSQWKGQQTTETFIQQVCTNLMPAHTYFVRILKSTCMLTLVQLGECALIPRDCPSHLYSPTLVRASSLEE
jgi:hypothetical protein